MYEYIKGTVAHIYPSYVVIELNGIGYHILMANPFRLSGNLKKNTQIYLYHDVRQDSIQLFGFMSLQEKSLFLKLINVSGIGPKSALAILANDNHAGFVQAIEDNNTAFLVKFPGVGKKTASQIVLDLKGKLSDFYVSDQQTSSEINKEKAYLNQSFEEALEALIALGYSKKDIEKVKKQLDPTENISTDAYIRKALSKLM